MTEFIPLYRHLCLKHKIAGYFTYVSLSIEVKWCKSFSTKSYLTAKIVNQTIYLTINITCITPRSLEVDKFYFISITSLLFAIAAHKADGSLHK